MKKYLLKLIQQDIFIIEQRILSWHRMEDKYKVDPYHLRILRANENKLAVAKKYKLKIISQ